jgi:hypothetical protein
MSRTHSIVTAVLLSAAPIAASPSGHAPAPEAQVPEPLRALRFALIKAGRAAALAEVVHFRPLCDRDGYPLVGNLANKGDMYQPSAFCTDVRQREAKG